MLAEVGFCLEFLKIDKISFRAATSDCNFFILMEIIPETLNSVRIAESKEVT